MPKLPAYVLRWSEENQCYELINMGRLEHCWGIDETPLLLNFLETHTSFAFEGRQGRLSVLKEARKRGAGYWYAYRSLGKRPAKRYLGITREMTIPHLERIAGDFVRAKLTPKVHEPDAETRAPSSPATALLLPKFQPPRLLSSLVERPRLLQRLDQARERKLTLLIAPAGFGKTTLMNQWIEQNHTLFLAWVSLESSDNDLLRFWRSFITACQVQQQHLGQSALTLLGEVWQPPFQPPPLEMVLTHFLNDLAQHVPDGLLILDDYHSVEEPRIHETLAFFIDHLPANMRVVLLTRDEPPLPLLRWRAKGELAELHGIDLRFSGEEAESFARKAFSLQLSDTARQELARSLQGWAAGLRLLSLALPEQMNQQRFEEMLVSLDHTPDPSSPYQAPIDYLINEILHKQPAQLQEFLLQTSVLRRLSAPLCAAVTRLEHCEERLKAIEQAGLFLETLDAAGGWYRYHALFAEALRREAVLRLGEENIRMFALRASSWYEQHALMTEAIEAALLAQNFARVATLVEQISMDEQTVELSTIRCWLSSVPHTVLRAHPMLCWFAALAVQEETRDSNTTAQQVDTLLRMAEDGWRQQGKQAELSLLVVFHAMGAWKAERFSQAQEYAQQAIALLPREEQKSHFHMWRGICLFIMGNGYMYDGQWNQARACFIEAHTLSLTSHNRHFTCSMLLLVGICSYLVGDLSQAHEYYQQVLTAARQQEDREIIAQALSGLTSIAFERNELALAEHQTNEVLALASEEEEGLRISATVQLAQITYARGHLTSAQQQCSRLLARLQISTTREALRKRSDVLVFSARLALATGDFQTALRLLETPDLQAHVAARMLQARLFLAENRTHEALLLLEHLLPDIRMYYDSIEIHLLYTLAYAARREDEQARQHLRQALSQGRTEGLIRVFIAEGEPLARLLRQLLPTLQEPALRSYARVLLRAFTAPLEVNVPNILPARALPFEPLSVQEQRVLQLIARGDSNRQIAQDLFISVNTVKDHIKHIYRKLGVHNRLQASEAARDLRLS